MAEKFKLTAQEKKDWELMKLAAEAVIKEDIKLLKEVAKH